MISKTQLKHRTKRKTNSVLVETLELARVLPAWNKLAQILSGSTRIHPVANLSKISSLKGEHTTIVVPGKVLGVGTLDKKVKLAALGFSESAKTKLNTQKIEMISILEEIKRNPEAKGVYVYYE